MENKLVSVILPVYNVEKYLDECYKTVKNQTYENIEIIFVDDGSTDSSGKKCDEYAQNDKRIKVIHKKNAGLGMARNSGLDIATGDYVVFVDSDDFIAENMIEKLMISVQEYDADTVYCSSVRYYGDGNSIIWRNKYDNAVFEKEDILQNVLLEMIASSPDEKEDQYIAMSVWHAIFSMQVIRGNNIRFHSEREFTSEDIIFDIDYLQCSNRVAFIPDSLYYYRLNKNSLSKKYNPDRFQKEKILYREIVCKLEKILPEATFIARVNRMFLGRVRGNIMLACTDTHENKLGRIKVIVEDEEVRQAIRCYPYNKNPIRQRVFNFCIDKRLILLLFIMGYIIGRKNTRR